jgi:hypothetical protein
MFVVMLLCALPSILFAPMTIFGALSLRPLAIIFLCFGVLGIALMAFYYRYSCDPWHDANQRRRIWFWWIASICAHLAIIGFMQWFVGRVGAVPFSLVSVMAGYLLLITPVSIGLMIASGLVLALDLIAFRSTERDRNAEQVMPPNGP